MTRVGQQNGYILLPVVLFITVIATIAFLINNDSTINADMTVAAIEAEKVQQVAQAGLVHAIWGAQNSGCAGDMGMTTVPFGQAGSGSYDATVTTQGGTTTAYSLSADQDAWFRSDDITVNNGSTATYHLRKESGNLEYAVVRFDLSTLPAGAQINSATVRFYVTATKGHPEGPVAVHRVTADWTETGATWETMGDKYDSAVLNSIPAQPDAGDVWLAVNLTAQVQSWVNGGQPNYGIMLIPTGEGTHAEYMTRDAGVGTRPRLDVIVGTGPATPATITATGTLTGNPSPANDITRTLTRSAVPAWQPPSTQVLQPGASLGKDTYISGNQTSKNYGAAPLLPARNGANQNSLLQFDFSSIDKNVYILSAQLELYAVAATNFGAVDVHHLNNSWVEGTCSGGSCTADGATWVTRDGSVTWNNAGGDYQVSAEGSVPVTALNQYYAWDITALVKDWVRGASPNNGVIIRPASGSDLDFASSDDIDTTRHPKLTITYACECGSPCLAPQGSGALLMVVVNPTTLVPLDADKKALFESWGYTVAVIGESQNQTAYDSAVAAADVVFISETVNASQVGTKLKDVTIGVVSQDGVYNGALGFAAGSAWSVGPALNVTDNSHYITALFPAGPLDIYAAAMEQLTVSGTVAPGLQTLADTGGAGSLVVLDKGALGSGGTPLAGRRVLLPLGRDSNLNWDYLNANGRLLVQRALQWGTGNTGGAPVGELLLVVGDAASPASKDTGRKTLIESWGYTVTLIDDDDSQANFDAAAAAADVVYVSGTVVDGKLADKLTGSPTPVVNEDWDKTDNFGFSDAGYNISYDRTAVTDPLHYITEPFGGNEVVIATTGIVMKTAYGTVAPDLQFVGEVVGGFPGLSALDAGAQRWDATPAPARRVQVPFQNAETSQLTADGLTLMRRSIEWAGGAGCGSLTPLLLVVSDASSPSSQEAARQTLIESWCYPVTLIDDDATTAEYAAAMAVNDVIYISQEITSLTNVTKLRDAAIGVVNEEYLISSDLGLGSGTGTGFYNDINLVDNTHYITSGFSLGALALFSPAYDLYTGTGFTLAPDLQVLGETGAITGLVALESGGSLWDSGTAPGRRVQVPWGDNFSALNADSQTLMRRAIEWAATPPPPSCNADYPPDTLVDEIPTTSRGLAYLPEGTIFSGATAPTGGAWVIVDASETIVMTDLAGNPLATCTLSIGVPDNPEGVTFVESGLWADHLAIMVAGLDDVLFLDAGCSVAGSFSTSVFSATSPTGIAFIGQTASGTYEGYLAIANMGSQTLHVVDQNGTQSYAIDVSALVGNVQGVVHIPATDKLLLADSNNGKAVIIDFVSFDGTALAEYDIAVHGMPGPDAAAINRATCDHVFGDSNTNKIISLNTSGGGGGGSPPACEGTLRDEFNAQVWSGSDGTLSWATDWLEWGEGGTPTGGDIMVMDDQGPYSARVRDNGTSSNGAGIRREADLSAYTTATLSFDYRRDGPDSANDYVTVDVSDNGGATWTELDRFIGEGTNTTDPDYVSTSYDISAYMSVNTRIRFLSSPNFGNQDVVYFDNVEICVVN